MRWARHKNIRGATLATTLVVISLALLLGLALAGSSVVSLHHSTMTVTRVRADNAAETALAEACERLLSEPEFGTSESSSDKVEVEVSGGRGYLSFENDSAAELGVPFSTNNRFGLEAVNGWNGSVVPPHCVQLFSEGESNGSTTLIECVLRMPEFPYVIASSGPVSSSGSLVIGAAESLEDIANSTELEPAALAANSEVDISGNAVVYGHIESTENIMLGDGVRIRGEVRPNSSKVELNKLDIVSLRPPNSFPLPSFISPELGGRYHHNGPQLTITGGLRLNDGVLYVNGDTTIRGGIQGKGAIIVNGDLTVEGSSILSAETQLALVTQGDLTLRGDSSDSSFFQGLIYTEGDFWAEDVTLVGAFAANRGGDDSVDPGSRIELHNTAVVSFPQYGTFDLDAVPLMIWGDGGKESQGGREVLTLLEVDEQDLEEFSKAISNERVNSGGEGGPGGTETPFSTYRKRVDLDRMLAVTRGRRVTVENGRLVSDWLVLGPEEVKSVLSKIETSGGDITYSGENGHLGPGYGGTATGGEGGSSALDFRADPTSLFWEEVHASLHLDLNEFLGQNSRIRVASWRKL